MFLGQIGITTPHHISDNFLTHTGTNIPLFYMYYILAVETDVKITIFFRN